jgi:hypothetical protein
MIETSFVLDETGLRKRGNSVVDQTGTELQQEEGIL